jgi:hypothetical protein
MPEFIDGPPAPTGVRRCVPAVHGRRPADGGGDPTVGRAVSCGCRAAPGYCTVIVFDLFDVTVFEASRTLIL